MNLVALPAFADNYIWMLHDGREALVVDPGDSAPVLDALATLGLTLTSILVTHHHADHVGGLIGLQSVLKGPIFGPATESMPCAVTACLEGDLCRWRGLTFQVMAVPGHTADHIAFYQPATPTDAAHLFCGDTLFSAGCGRLFEGTPSQMAHSLSRLAALPASTQLCCAHEYTLSNLRFALATDPHNPALIRHAAHCAQLRERGEATLPSTIGLECQINPFLRCDQPALIAAAQARSAPGTPTDPVQVFTTLREWKNQFR
jgi:hydroxyacylglutathione hydrolase